MLPEGSVILKFPHTRIFSLFLKFQLQLWTFENRFFCCISKRNKIYKMYVK